MLLLWLMAIGCGLGAGEPVHFSRQILPILSEKCLGCHGQDPSSRKANLRLDTREGALEVRGGKAAVVPGDPGASRMLVRIAAPKAAMLMPPPYSHKAPLTAEEIQVVEQWIREGAPWGKHWSFERPVAVRGDVAGRGDIDELLGRKMAGKGLVANGVAPRHTLARRLAFDITGLPPQGDAARKVLAGGAISDYVDALLESPQYGERMAMWWLDAARYSDTDGFQADDTRTNWPWRDWVVAAFNKNMPYDQFTVEQFAGDLLPGATVEQKLATSFHRQHMTNGEGGRDPEESRIDYVMDRVNTMGTVWLGLTLQCTQCHTHKFDPIEHKEYYALNAFFNSIDETGQAGKKAGPYVPYASPFAQRAIDEAKGLVAARKPEEARQRELAQPAFRAWLRKQAAALPRDFEEWSLVRQATFESAEGTVLRLGADGVISATGPDPKQDDYRIAMRPGLARMSGLKLEVFPDAAFANGKFTRNGSGEFLLTDVKLQVRQKGNSQVRDIKIEGAVADYSADKKKHNNYGAVQDTLDDDPRNGWTTLEAPKVEKHTAVFRLAEPLQLAADEELVFEMRHRSTEGQGNIAKFRLSVTAGLGPVLEGVGASPLERLARLGNRSAVPQDLRDLLEKQFLAGHGGYQKAFAALQRAEKELKELEAARTVNVMVLAEREKPRETHVLLRGVWDKKGEKVKPTVPAFLGELPEGSARDRLGLARWLVSRENPLAARVAVNHIWQLLFGVGLVRTTEDFGLQGERPVQDELLDTLAVEFVESGWDVKKLVRRIVLSAAYQRDSTLTPELEAKDPNNFYLARGPRYRLASWMLRDAALSYAGLLNPALGGPPVRPYQPEGVWEELFMGRFRYEPSEGAAQYRRTLYAFWRRSIAPTFLFDSAQRRMCEVRPGRTNTPLQALTLLNDETYLEAARVMAQQMGAEKKPLEVLFERVLLRKPTAREVAVLQREYRKALAEYAAKPKQATALLTVGQNPPLRASAREAALMVVGSLILNLDEVLTHE